MGTSTELRRTISARVRTAIEQAEESWVSVARLTGIPRETLRRRLTDINPFDVDELEAIALCLNLKPDAFLDSQRWSEAS